MKLVHFYCNFSVNVPIIWQMSSTKMHLVPALTSRGNFLFYNTTPSLSDNNWELKHWQRLPRGQRVVKNEFVFYLVISLTSIDLFSKLIGLRTCLGSICNASRAFNNKWKYMYEKLSTAVHVLPNRQNLVISRSSRYRWQAPWGAYENLKGNEMFLALSRRS